MLKGGNGFGWVDQWDFYYDGDKVNNVGGFKECNKNEKMDKVKVVVSVGLWKMKVVVIVRMVKMKVVVIVGVKKLKVGMLVSLKWIKGKVKK